MKPFVMIKRKEDISTATGGSYLFRHVVQKNTIVLSQQLFLTRKKSTTNFQQKCL
jgi:hypothetical protein